MNNTFTIFYVFITFSFALKITAATLPKEEKTIFPNTTSFYVSISEIVPAQLRYASRNVQEKKNKKIKNNDAIWNPDKSCWIYKYDQGRSIFSFEEAFPVVKASFGYVLTDGHHDVLSSLVLGAQRIPVKVIADLSSLTEDQFWIEAENTGLAYLYDTDGKRKIPPRDFKNLKDDPNRFFAAITARKCLKGSSINDSIGADYPIWIKVGKDIPFIEFHIADVLWKNHLIYQYEMGNNPPEDFVEQARKAIVAAKIEGLRVVAVRKYFRDLESACID